jgi:hypothetical protein
MNVDSANELQAVDTATLSKVQVSLESASVPRIRTNGRQG